MGKNRIKNKDLKDIEIKRVRNKEYGKRIFKILNERLLTKKDIKKLNKDQKEKLEEMGFVIGEHSLQDLEGWIANVENHIIIAEKNNSKNGKIMGFCLLLGTEEIKQKVRKYGKDVIFEKPEYKNTIFKEDLLYLIQIGVAKKFSNLGVGSRILNEVFKMTNKPIVSFVVKSPIKNKASLYFHLRNKFDYFGDYIGEYGNFEEYRSIGLLYKPNNPLRKRKTVLDLMEFIYKNNKRRN